MKYAGSSLLLTLLVTLSPSTISSALNLLPSALAYSLNQTISEQGVALMYNSHLDEYDPDVEESGTPVIYGYLYLQNPNETYEGTNGTDPEDYIHPKWTKSNTLRVCMQYWDDAEASNSSANLTITQVRWVLNYTFPMKYANWTPQVSLLQNQTLNDSTIKDWCSRSVNWGGMLEENGKTRYQNDPTLKKREEAYLEEVREAEEAAALEANRTQAEIAAQAPKAGDKAPDEESDQEVAKLESDAEAISQATTETDTPLPDPLFGIETLEMNCETIT